MTDRHDSIARLFSTGEYGRLLEVTRTDSANVLAEPVRTAMVAQAAFETGDVTKAHTWATLCSKSQVPAARARGQLVLALCVRANGHMGHALQLHQAALRSAEEANDYELEAWAALHLLRHLIVTGRNVADAVVPTTRAKAAKAGSVHATAYLHAIVAAGDGQAGRPEEARRHLDIAGRLLHGNPHPWLQCAILNTLAATAMAERELSETADCLERLREIAREHRLVADYARANVNIGNLAFLTGKYDSAESALQEVIDSTHTSVIAKLTAAETLAEVRLAQDRLPECEAILHDIEEKANVAGLMDAFAVRWGGLTRAQMLIRQGHVRAAVEQLVGLKSRLGDVSDRPLMAGIAVTTAQALVMSGDAAGGAKQLAASVMLDPTALPHVQGQFYYAAAVAVSPSNSQLAGSIRLRARRIFESQGTAPLRFEPLSDAHSPDVSFKSVGGDAVDGANNAVVVESIASLLGMGNSPNVLAQELLLIVRRLNCSPRAALSAEIGAGPEQDGELQLAIPQKDSASLTLTCAVPSSPDQAVTLGSVIRVGQLALELERLRKAERHRAALWPDASVEASAGAIFESDAMRDVLTVVRRIADTSVPVLITGETGTGKEVLARLIHAYSGRSKAAFTPFNCTLMSRDVVESQLFGHRRGAFTGATDHSEGVIRGVNGGTLLLDEIGDMPIDVQPKLLRFLESGEVHPLGEPKPTQVDVRVVAATNVDLRGLLSSGRFREDLYYRLSIVPLHLPPLRDRRSEIPSLATHYLKKHAQDFRKGDLRLSEDAMEYLLLFRWPGNVRQLANEMRRVAAFAETGAVIMPEHLSPDITGVSPTRKKNDVPRRELRDNETVVRLDQPLAAAVEHIERAMIAKALVRTNGGMERAAALLGLSRKGLYLKRQKYQIGSMEDDPD